MYFYFQKTWVTNQDFMVGIMLLKEISKSFLAHLIAMGLVRKGSIPKYWDHGETVKTAYFRTYMGGTEYISEHSVKLTGVRLQFRSSIQPPSS